MQFTTSTLLATVLAFSGVLTQAASVPLEKRGCKGSDSFCGDCNGTSCKIGLINYSCKSGTSCVGTGGGDGAYCYVPDTGSLAQGPYICPVST